MKSYLLNETERASANGKNHFVYIMRAGRLIELHETLDREGAVNVARCAVGMGNTVRIVYNGRCIYTNN